MRLITIFTIILLICLTGCATKYVCEDGKVVSDLSMCKKTQAAAPEQEPAQKPATTPTKQETIIEIPAETPTEIKKEIEPDVQALIDKTNTYDNYEFSYTQPKQEYSISVMINGKRMKYRLKDHVEQYQLKEFYDTVVLNKEQETAYQYCASLSKCEEDNRKFIRQVDYEKMKMVTLQDVMNSLVKAKIVGEELMYNKNSEVVEYTDTSGKTGKIWIDSYFGVPLKKEYEIDGEKQSELFYGFSKGGITEDMVTAPPNLEIK
jgi:hypothetical protein